MSNFQILEGKLRFLRSFYQLTTEPFRELKRKIDEHEEPFVDSGNPEDYDGEPPFLTEWLEADEGLKLQQQVCLAVLQRSFKEFLDMTVRLHPDYPNNKPKEGGNWFENYKSWFLKEADIDWNMSPVPLSRMEELTLARNCVQHGGESPKAGPKNVFDSHSLVKMQSDDYHARFPDGFFVNEFESQIWKDSEFPQPVTIELSPEKMDTALEQVLSFCEFVASREEA